MALPSQGKNCIKRSEKVKHLMQIDPDVFAPSFKVANHGHELLVAVTLFLLVASAMAYAPYILWVPSNFGLISKLRCIELFDRVEIRTALLGGDKPEPLHQGQRLDCG